MNTASKIAGFDGTPALVTLAVTGNTITIILAVVLAYTFVKTVWMEQSVGNRRVYENVIPFFNSLMWALYTSDSLPYKPFFFCSNGLGFVLQIICTFIYIYFAEGKKRTRALLLFFTFLVFALIITAVVAWMVVTHRWNSTFIDVIASISGVSMHIVTLFDLVMKRKEINNMNPITQLISLLGASTWTAYGFMSVPINCYVMVPNLVGIVSVAVQLIRFAVHCKAKTETEEMAEIEAEHEAEAEAEAEHEVEAEAENEETYNAGIISPDFGSGLEMAIAIHDLHDDIPNSAFEPDIMIASPV